MSIASLKLPEAVRGATVQNTKRGCDGRSLTEIKFANALGKFVDLIILKNCAFVLNPCLGKLFRLWLSTSIFPSIRNYGYLQPVVKKGDSSNSSN